jgi:hypothetical protein
MLVFMFSREYKYVSSIYLPYVSIPISLSLSLYTAIYVYMHSAKEHLIERQ